MNRFILFAALVLSGCQEKHWYPLPQQAEQVEGPKAVDYTPDYEQGRGAASSFITFVSTEGVTPGPAPPGPAPPAPGESCRRCNGTGRIKPDGRIDLACPDCGGDGKLSTSEVHEILDRLQKPDQVVPPSPAPPAPTPPKPTPDPTPIPLPGPTAKVELKWFTTLEEGYRESQRTGKQAIIYWWGTSCKQPGKPCWQMEKYVWSDPEVRRILADRYVCVFINAEDWSTSENERDQRRLDIWLPRRRVPAVTIVNAAWDDSKQFAPNCKDPKELADNLNTVWFKAAPDKSATKPTSSLRRVSCGHPDCECYPTCDCRWWGECRGVPKAVGESLSAEYLSSDNFLASVKVQP